MASDDDPVDPFADLPGDVGDDREKFVRVTLASGEQVEHGDVFVRYTEQEFIIADSMDFAEDETTQYRKGEVVQVEVQQHHPKCFITTAVAEPTTLTTLRGFRADVMASSWIGRRLLGVYDIVSPPVARTLARSPNSRTAVAVRWFVARAATVERRRQRRGRGSAIYVAALVFLYLVGLSVATGGALVIRAVDPITG